MIGVKLEAPGAFSDHCTVGASQLAGVEALALKLTLPGSVTVWSLGCSSIAGLIVHGGGGAGLTVRVASLLVVSPAALVKAASKAAPLSVVLVVGIVYVLELA